MPQRLRMAPRKSVEKAATAVDKRPVGERQVGKPRSCRASRIRAQRGALPASGAEMGVRGKVAGRLEQKTRTIQDVPGASSCLKP